jgi:hypothetical protein
VGLSRQAPAALLAGAGAAGASVQGDDLLEAAAGFVGDQVTGMVVVAPVLSLLQKWSKLDLLCGRWGKILGAEAGAFLGPVGMLGGAFLGWMFS